MKENSLHENGSKKITSTPVYCKNTPNKLSSLRMWMLLAAICLIALSPAWARPVPNYTNLQTFKGQAYYKDENIWIYTKEFAQAFGMPDQWVSNKLVGVEAIVFRVEAAELTCGLVGRADVCTRNERYVTEVYVDEVKHPLPWSGEQTADWLPITDSSGWLYRASDGIPARPYLPANVKPPTIHTLMPWVNQASGRVAMYYEDSSYTEPNTNHLQLLAYKRKLSGHLTMLKFNYRSNARDKKKAFTAFRLELRKNGIGTAVLKRYHEFRIPEEFERRIDDIVEAHRRKDNVQYKRLLNLKSK